MLDGGTGAVTLGLFRPYRFAESPIAFRKLCVLFLAYVQMNYQSGKTKAKTTTTTTTKLEEVFNSKEKKLERFREELKFAGIHDVVALLKWVGFLSLSLLFFLSFQCHADFDYRNL